MKLCKRCGQLLEEKFFQEPVTICLICYHMIPANRELDWPELRDKASKSYKATRRRNIELRNQFWESHEDGPNIVDTRTASLLGNVHNTEEEYDVGEEFECYLCHKMVTKGGPTPLITKDNEDPEMCCLDCMPPKERKKMSKYWANRIRAENAVKQAGLANITTDDILARMRGTKNES